MNKREKILAAAVGALLGVLLIYFMIARVGTSFSRRSDQIENLESEIRKKENLVTRGKRAAKKMQRFEEQSLPGDVDRAQSLYSKWLFDLAGELNLKDLELNPTRVRTRDKSFRTLQFTLKARGNLEQLTHLLYRFYSTDYLHRFRSLRIRGVPGSKDLDLSITINALSLVGAKSDAMLSDQQSDRLAHKDISPYLKAILGRNLFGPPNQAPRLASISTQQISNDRSLSLTARASDQDKLDKLTWSLVDDLLAGAEIDAGSGQLRWSPKKNGTYLVKIRVDDDGYPSKSDTQTVTIVVSDPPPPAVVDTKPSKPSFDVAKYTVLTTIFEVNGRRRIYLYQRTTDKEVLLYEGDPFEIGSISGTILRIGEKQVEIEIDEKSRWLNLGSALSETQSQPNERKLPGISQNQP